MEYSDAQKLRALASWMDRIQSSWFKRKILGWSNSFVVQNDLRRIADRLDQNKTTVIGDDRFRNEG